MMCAEFRSALLAEFSMKKEVEGKKKEMVESDGVE